jgi:FkbM family methyltransferase
MCPPLRRAAILHHYHIDLVLDVGANEGTYGAAIRRAGYSGAIRAFEPQSRPFAALAARARGDDHWECRQVALGAAAGCARLNVARGTTASSFLPHAARTFATPVASEYVGSETVPVVTLDEVTADVSDTRSIYLKIDTEGYEARVLQGAQRVLSIACAVELELSLVPLWRDAPPYLEMQQLLASRGFNLLSVECVTENVQTGEMVQVDAIFGRRHRQACGGPQRDEAP